MSRRTDADLTYVSVYDPRTSVFADVPLYVRGKLAPCRNIGFPSLATQPSADLNFVESETFRKLFDRYREDPEQLKQAINAGPPYFRVDGKWDGRRSALNLDGYRISNTKTVDDLAKYLKNLDAKTAASMIRSRLAFVASVEERQEQKRLQTRRAKDIWESRLTNTYRTGDKVCTHDSNLFGYVEEIQKDRIKVHVIGRASLGAIEVRGLFFQGYDGRFDYERIEAIRWLTRDEIAPCTFSDGPVKG